MKSGFITKWFVFFASMLLSGLVTAEKTAYEEGVDYYRITPAQPTYVDNGKIEVLELFWYGCPHCYHLESSVHEWLKNKPANAEYVRLPSILNDMWALHAQAYYTAEVLGVVEKIHTPLFDAIHKERKTTLIGSDKSIRSFFIEHGVSEQDFDNAWNSFPVKTKVNRAKIVGSRYGATGVPALIVNGKFRVTATSAGGSENVMKVVDYLVRQESAAAQASK